MERVPGSIRLITDSMSGGGVANERFSMTGVGSPSIDVDSTIMPPEQLGNVMQAPGDHPVVFNEHHQAVDGHPNGGPGEDPGLGHGWDECTQTGNGGWKQL